MDMQNYTTPFANTGDREEFSIDTDPSGKVSLEKGWTELYQLRPEEGGLFILRKVFNQMMKLVSTDTVTWKTQTFPNWIDDKGDGLPYAYPKNAIVKYTDGNTYVSKIDNNTAIPTDSNNWVNFEDFGSLNINGLPEKTTPDNTDNLALQETGGLLKKLSFANLKLWILSLFNPSITGTVSFTSTTNNIQLTNIVTSLSLEIGDVIQITGSTNNNDYYTVEVITDNNNIIVNQAHANKSLTYPDGKRTKTLNTETSSTTIKLASKYYNAPLGLGQDWVDVLSSRTAGTIYQNLTNRTIKVSTVIENQVERSLYVNGIVITKGGATTGGTTRLPLQAEVSRYSKYNLEATTLINVWKEFR